MPHVLGKPHAGLRAESSRSCSSFCSNPPEDWAESGRDQGPRLTFRTPRVGRPGGHNGAGLGLFRSALASGDTERERRLHRNELADPRPRTATGAHHLNSA